MIFKKIFYSVSLFIFILNLSLSGPALAFAQVATTTQVAPTASTTETVYATTTVSFNPTSPLDVEKMVRNYFSDIPIMALIAKCESGFRQFKSDGAVLYGGAGGAMIGIFQIFSGHIPKALSLGFDIKTIDGNLAYTRYLYTKQNTDPWISSIDCWNQNQTSAETTGSSEPLNKNLSFGMTDPQVKLVQQILNRSGFVLINDGTAGSPGFETTKFGNLTRSAIKNFQCVKNIVCSGNEYTTGYGLIDSRTRSALLSLNTSTTVTSPPPIQRIDLDDSPEITELKVRIVQLLALVEELQKQLASLR